MINYSYTIDAKDKEDPGLKDFYIEISDGRDSIKFFSGFHVSENVYRDHLNGSISNELMSYLFHQHFNYKLATIDKILFERSITHINEPQDFLGEARKQILEEMHLLNTFNSYSNCLLGFVIGNFREIDPDDEEPYEVYSIYHRLYDALAEYQTINDFHLDKNFKNFKSLLYFLDSYKVGDKYYDLVPAFRTFINFLCDNEFAIVDHEIRLLVERF